MKKVLLAGAGKIGGMIANLLTSTGDCQVTVLDRSAEQLASLPQHTLLRTRELDLSDDVQLQDATRDQFAVLSAARYSITSHIARAARKANVHYLDLTE